MYCCYVRTFLCPATVCWGDVDTPRPFSCPHTRSCDEVERHWNSHGVHYSWRSLYSVWNWPWPVFLVLVFSSGCMGQHGALDVVFCRLFCNLADHSYSTGYVGPGECKYTHLLMFVLYSPPVSDCSPAPGWFALWVFHIRFMARRPILQSPCTCHAVTRAPGFYGLHWKCWLKRVGWFVQHYRHLCVCVRNTLEKFSPLSPLG